MEIDPRAMPNPEAAQPVSEDVKTEATPVAEVVTPEEVLPPAPQVQVRGSKTPEPNLIAALDEERAKRKELERKLEELTINPSVSSGELEDVFSDEGRLLKKQISTLEEKILSLEEEKQIEKVMTQYPELRDMPAEFNEFRAEYPRHKLENVAKLFLVEKGLLEAPRKGLEKTTGGSKAPVASGISKEDVKRLRETDFRQYSKLLMEGKIRPEDII